MLSKRFEKIAYKHNQNQTSQSLMKNVEKPQSCIIMRIFGVLVLMSMFLRVVENKMKRFVSMPHVEGIYKYR